MIHGEQVACVAAVLQCCCTYNPCSGTGLTAFNSTVLCVQRDNVNMSGQSLKAFCFTYPSGVQGRRLQLGASRSPVIQFIVHPRGAGQFEILIINTCFNENDAYSVRRNTKMPCYQLLIDEGLRSAILLILLLEDFNHELYLAAFPPRLSLISSLLFVGCLSRSEIFLSGVSNTNQITENLFILHLVNVLY